MAWRPLCGAGIANLVPRTLVERTRAGAFLRQDALVALGVDDHLQADEGGVAALGAELAVERLLPREAAGAAEHLRRAGEAG